MKTMETIKLIDLINKIANEKKLPKKILIDDIVFNITSERDFYNNMYGFLSNKVYLNKKMFKQRNNNIGGIIWIF